MKAKHKKKFFERTCKDFLSRRGVKHASVCVILAIVLAVGMIPLQSFSVVSKFSIRNATEANAETNDAEINNSTDSTSQDTSLNSGEEAPQPQEQAIDDDSTESTKSDENTSGTDAGLVDSDGADNSENADSSEGSDNSEDADSSTSNDGETPKAVFTQLPDTDTMNCTFYYDDVNHSDDQGYKASLWTDGDFSTDSEWTDYMPTVNGTITFDSTFAGYLWEDREGDASSIFKGSHATTFANFENFKIFSVDNASSMFEGCENVTSLDFTSWVKDLGGGTETGPDFTYASKMFYECTSLQYIYVKASNIIFNADFDSSDAFKYCNALRSDIREHNDVYDSSAVDFTRAYVDQFPSTFEFDPGYLSLKDREKFNATINLGEGKIKDDKEAPEGWDVQSDGTYKKEFFINTPYSDILKGWDKSIIQPQDDYEFIGWNPQEGTLREDTIFKAQYSQLQDFNVDAGGYSDQYDGQQHSITVTVNEPPDVYTIEYKVDGEPEWTTENPTFKDYTEGAKTVNFRISAEHYKTYEDSRTVEIKQRELTVSGLTEPQSREYNGSMKADVGFDLATIESEDFVPGETVSIESVDASFTTKNVINNDTVTVNAVIFKDGTGGGLGKNYKASDASLVEFKNVSIIKRPINIGDIEDSKGYDGTPFAYTGDVTEAEGIVEGETITYTFTTNSPNIGEYKTIGVDITADYVPDSATTLLTNYAIEGPTNIKLTITKKQLSQCIIEITIDGDDFTYCGGPLYPTCTVKNGDTVLEVGTDFEFDYDETKLVGINADTYPVKIIATPSGNYDGTNTSSWTINPRPLSDDCYYYYYDKPEYNWAEQIPLVEVYDDNGYYLYAGSDYEVVGDKHKDCGSNYSFIVKGKGNYTGQSSTQTWSIVPRSIVGAEVTLAGKPLIDNGEVQTQEIESVVVYDDDAVPHELDLDNDVTITGNTSAQPDTKHSITITAKNNTNFTGQITNITWVIIGEHIGDLINSPEKGGPDVGPNAPNADITGPTDTKEVIETIASADDLKKLVDGKDEDVKMKYNLDSEDATETIAEEQKTALDQEITGNGETVGQYVDISIKKHINEEETKLKGELDQPITIEVDIPPSMLNQDPNDYRDYYIYHVSADGTVQKIDATYDPTTHKLTFATKDLTTSIFAIAFKNVRAPIPPDPPIYIDATTTAQSGDMLGLLELAILGLGSIAFLGLYVALRRRNKLTN